ncbi:MULTISPECIES: hypothetical protein [Pseudomonas]|jgi:hypothetical protein|uniref:Uncharacterized protein n=2 Tax=Pseudomonas TaxID=286 RepID=A0A502HXX1_9PSED|nr:MULTISPECIES: hypothetical protein [Pseudomonas]MBK5399983.1 hypothetical protein [Pseudomonas sp. TH39(2020)]RON41582.1 hypothetical protein BK664_03265 [Pseudomonas brassicacearum]TPG78755.1 hypothetical protein EAH74_25690 [Pseudomonas mandelii]TPG97146.1 hypothetical protein EAH72_09225 [Pseudomonas caspiana]
MSALESFVIDAQHCAALFRLGRDVEAGLAMIELIGALQPSFDLALPAAQQQWVRLLGPMLECQESLNWLALADYLEYELVQLLTDSLSI